MTIQMKATEQYFPVVLFIMLYEVIRMFGLWIKSSSVIVMLDAVKIIVILSIFRVLHIKPCCVTWEL